MAVLGQNPAGLARGADTTGGVSTLSQEEERKRKEQEEQRKAQDDLAAKASTTTTAQQRMNAATAAASTSPGRQEGESAEAYLARIERLNVQERERLAQEQRFREQAKDATLADLRFPVPDQEQLERALVQSGVDPARARLQAEDIARGLPAPTGAKEAAQFRIQAEAASKDGREEESLRLLERAERLEGELAGFKPETIQKAQELRRVSLADQQAAKASASGAEATEARTEADDRQARALAAVEPYRSAQGYDLATAVRLGVTDRTLAQAGFSQFDIQRARTLAKAQDRLQRYEVAPGTYDLARAVRDGVSFDTLTDAGFSTADILTVRRQVDALKVLERWRIQNTNDYDLVMASNAGVSGQTMLDAGFPDKAVRDAIRGRSLDDSAPLPVRVPTPKPVKVEKTTYNAREEALGKLGFAAGTTAVAKGTAPLPRIPGVGPLAVVAAGITVAYLISQALKERQAQVTQTPAAPAIPQRTTFPLDPTARQGIAGIPATRQQPTVTDVPSRSVAPEIIQRATATEAPSPALEKEAPAVSPEELLSRRYREDLERILRDAERGRVARSTQDDTDLKRAILANAAQVQVQSASPAPVRQQQTVAAQAAAAAMALSLLKGQTVKQATNAAMQALAQTRYGATLSASEKTALRTALQAQVRAATVTGTGARASSATRTQTQASPATATRTATATTTAKTSATSAIAARTASRTAVRARTLRMPRGGALTFGGITLPPGRYPKRSQWVQGFIQYNANYVTGRTTATPTTRRGTPASTFRILETTGTRPRFLRLPMGIVEAQANGQLRFRRRAFTPRRFRGR